MADFQADNKTVTKIHAMGRENLYRRMFHWVIDHSTTDRVP